MPSLKGFITGAVVVMALAIATSATAQTQNLSNTASRGAQLTGKQISARPVASLQVKPPTSASRYRHTRIYRQSCVPALIGNTVSVVTPLLSQSPARVQEDSAERVQALPGTQPHSEELVQSMPPYR